MCNCNFDATSLTPESKGASETTIRMNGDIRKYRPVGLTESLAKQQEYAKKGLLVNHTLVVKDPETGTDIFNSSCYDFLSNCNYDTIHPNLQDHALVNGNMGLFRVNRISAKEADLIAQGKRVEAKIGDVFQIRGYDLANMTVVMGQSGFIVMDVLTSKETAECAMQLLQKNVYTAGIAGTPIPVKAIIYSHSHVDHYAGVGGLITQKEYDDKEKNIQIYAPKGFLENAVSENVYAGNAMSTRAAFMYGIPLTRSATGQVDAGLGKATSTGTKTLFAPKTEISFDRYKENCNYQEIKVDGITMQFQLTPGTEAPSEMNVYLPDFKVLFIAENCCGTLHNLYTLRGAEVRDALTWAHYLDETIATFGDVQTICSSHNWPQFNESEIENHVCIDYLKKQRNIYRYLGNTTLNLINKGYTIEEVGRKMERLMPAPLMDEWRNHGFYGSINHNAKAIYQKYIGWYDGNPSNLNKLMPIDAATKYVDSMGGAQKVLLFANTAFKNGEYAWAAELLNRLIFSKVRECDMGIKKQAKLLNADALEQLGYQSESAPWRNEYLTAAMFLRMEANGKAPKKAEQFELESSIVNAMSPEMLMQFMSIMFEIDIVQEEFPKLAGIVAFTDGEKQRLERFSYALQDGVLLFIPVPENDPTGSQDNFLGTKEQFYNCIMGKENPKSQPVTTRAFNELCSFIKPFINGFSIVSPPATGANDKRADSISTSIPQEKRIKIFQAANLIEQYEEQVVSLGNSYYETRISAASADKEIWLKLRDEIATSVKNPTNPVDDTMFFNKTGTTQHDEWGLGRDCIFNKSEYAHFLCECYRCIYIDAPKTPGLLNDCIKMLEPLVAHFKGKAPNEGELVTLNAENQTRWQNDFYPILVGLNIIADSMFTYPTDYTRHKYGIGTDGKYDFPELSNVLMRCYKAAMVDELYRLYKESKGIKDTSEPQEDF